jgi:hypothetical protein
VLGGFWVPQILGSLPLRSDLLFKKRKTMAFLPVINGKWGLKGGAVYSVSLGPSEGSLWGKE